MSSQSILEQLRRRLENDHRDPESRLLRDLSDLPSQLQQSPTLQIEMMCRVASEERLHREVDRGVQRIAQNSEAVLSGIHASASNWAEKKHLELLNGVVRKAWTEMPMNARARSRAYWEIGVGSIIIIMIAWFALIGAQVSGVLPHRELTAEENRQLAWARKVEKAGQTSSLEWAVEKLDTDAKLREAQASVEALDSGRSLRAENRDMRACVGPDMKLMQTTTGLVCWFPYKPGP